MVIEESVLHAGGAAGAVGAGAAQDATPLEYPGECELSFGVFKVAREEGSEAACFALGTDDVCAGETKLGSGSSSQPTIYSLESSHPPDPPTSIPSPWSSIHYPYMFAASFPSQRVVVIR